MRPDISEYKARHSKKTHVIEQLEPLQMMSADVASPYVADTSIDIRHDMFETLSQISAQEQSPLKDIDDRIASLHVSIADYRQSVEAAQRIRETLHNELDIARQELAEAEQRYSLAESDVKLRNKDLDGINAKIALFTRETQGISFPQFTPKQRDQFRAYPEKFRTISAAYDAVQQAFVAADKDVREKRLAVEELENQLFVENGHDAAWQEELASLHEQLATA